MAMVCRKGEVWCTSSNTVLLLVYAASAVMARLNGTASLVVLVSKMRARHFPPFAQMFYGKIEPIQCHFH
jgi:hypothetical protein